MTNLRTLFTAALLATVGTVGLSAQRLDPREAIDRTQADLRRAEHFERQHGKEVERYTNAQKHLSDFDRDFVRGHFDKDKLDAAIDDLKNVVDHNTLNPED